MECTMHAKQGNPSRIQAQPAKDRRPDRGLTYPLNPSNSCRKPSKTHLLGSHKIGTKSPRTDGWKHFQTAGLEKATAQNRWQLRPWLEWTYKGPENMECTMHAKQGNPSRIQAQPAKDRRPDRGLTYPLNPSNSCRKPSKTHLLGSHKIGTKSPRTDGWKHFQTAGLEKATAQNRWQLRPWLEWTYKGPENMEWTMHAKQGNPSRIQAQPAKDRRPDRGLTYPLNPSNSCRKPSKTHLLGSHKIGTKSSRTDGWKHFQTAGLEKATAQNRWQLRPWLEWT